MARFRSQTLSWRKGIEAESAVVGFNVYYAKGNKVDYDSESVYVQDLNEIVIPNELEGFVPERGIYMFGVTAVDQYGNESDMTKLKVPVHFKAPAAPEFFRVEGDELPPQPESVWVEIEKTVTEVKGRGLDKKADDGNGNATSIAKNLPGAQVLEFYDDMGYRKL